MAGPQRFDLSRDAPDEALAVATRALERGELVVVPTETVYGVAAREDRPRGVERLAALKRDRSRPYSLAIDGLPRVSERLEPLSSVAERIMERWWPGPVTLVLPTRDGGTLGLRVPGHPWTRRLLAAVGGPLLLPSANLPGAAAPVEAAALDPALLGAVSVVVDGGRAALGNASTVVAPGAGCLRILREGVVNRTDLARHAGANVLVVCSGNTCRSPMAAALLERAWRQVVASDPDVLPPRVQSAGLHAVEGCPASPAAVGVLLDHDLDLTAHASQSLTLALLEQTDLVLVMTSAQRSELSDLAAAVELFDPDGGEVEDPFGGGRSVYASCAARLEAMARARVRSSLPRGPREVRG